MLNSLSSFFLQKPKIPLKILSVSSSPSKFSMDRSLNLLDLALGFDEQLANPSPLNGKVILIEDCVETSGSFVLHQLMKRVLSPNSSDALIFLAFARPFSHYDRILRKLVKSFDLYLFCLQFHCFLQEFLSVLLCYRDVI